MKTAMATKKKRRNTKAPSPAQLAARAKFTAMVKERAAARKKAAGKAAKNPLRFKSEADFDKWTKTHGIKGGGTVAAPKARKKGKRFKKAPKQALARVFSGSGFLGLGKSRKTISARNPKPKKRNLSPKQRRTRAMTRRTRQQIVAFRQHGTRAKAQRRRLPNPRGSWLKFGERKGWGGKATRRGLKASGGIKGFSKHAERMTSHRERLRRGGRPRLPNPSPANVFSEFRGKGVTTKTRVKAARGTPSVLAKLGGLRELKLRGKTLRNFPAGAALAADGRKKLHITGVKLRVRGNPGGEVDMGEILSVTYRADKPHVESGTYDYVHKLGEEGGKRPHLIVDEEGYPIIEGGSYRITADGIID
jgi:hypothetical protein